MSRRLSRASRREGVARIAVTTEDIARYRDVDLPEIATVHDRGEMMKLQSELAATKGVTVLLHDQACATELRRARKRGRAPDPPERVFINERVCEGCGDCGVKSNCLSVEPIETEFGRKTRINQTTCNKDFSCLEGDCPSFLTVIPSVDRKREPRRPAIELPDPQRLSGDARVRIVGIGGTGVVTISQVLGVAALIDGRHVSGLDQTGLSQKAGPVVSDIRISGVPVVDGVTVPAGSVDLLLGLDLLTSASPASLRVADPARTVAVLSESLVPTASMVTDPTAARPEVDAARRAIDAATRADMNVHLDAQRLTERLLGDATTANVVVLGAALQAGTLPVSASALEEAFVMNGVAVEQNLAALAWGRAWVVDPDAVLAAADGSPVRRPLRGVDRTLLDRVAPDEGELRRLLEVRIPDLQSWGGKNAAERLVREVGRVRGIEADRVPGSTAVSEAVAFGLHKLIAYKDEYEVARLHLDAAESARIEEELGGVSKTTYLLHPPFLRALGMKRKLRFGGWFKPGLRTLRAGKRLRGTPFDPFGHTEVRRTERALPGEYRGYVETALAFLSPATHAACVELCETPTSSAVTRRSSWAGSSASAPGRRSSWTGSRRLSRRGPRGRTRRCRRARSSRQGSCARYCWW